MLVLVIAGMVLSGSGLTHEPQSAEAALLTEVKKLLASDAQDSDWFGFSVAVSGDTAVVGAVFEDDGGSDAGAVYVFGRDEGSPDNWGEVTKLIASDAEVFDLFGYSVAISGDTALVGAALEDAGGHNAGAAYVFQRDQGGTDNWGEVKKLLASDAEANDRFGDSVAVSGDTAVVGAEQEEAGGLRAGAAYIFQRDQGGTENWGEVKKLTASDAQAGDFFGKSAAVSSDTVVVGVFRGKTAYVFQRDDGGVNNWAEVSRLKACDDVTSSGFGHSVAVSGSTTVVGAFRADDSVGAAYVFEFGLGDCDGDGVPDDEDACPGHASRRGRRRQWLYANASY